MDEITKMRQDFDEFFKAFKYNDLVLQEIAYHIWVKATEKACDNLTDYLNERVKDER